MKIKDKMWNGGYPMMSYEVVAEIKREKNIQYELLCEQCNHGGENCRILITKNDQNEYVYVGMVNENYEDRDGFSGRQYYFHKDNGNFYPTKEEAEIEKVKKYISNCNKEIKKHKEGIEYQEKLKMEYEDRLKAYQEVKNKIDEIIK